MDAVGVGVAPKFGIVFGDVPKAVVIGVLLVKCGDFGGGAGGGESAFPDFESINFSFE